MIYEICAQTDIGLMRGNNEDVVAFDPLTQLCILADGMGGYNAGEIASAMAVALVKAEMSRWLSQAGAQAKAKEVRRTMEVCVENANHSIFNAGSSNPQYEGMGTTLVVAVFQQDWLVLGHVGDSRCYRLRGTEFRQITRDHSLLQEQIDAGLITPEQSLTALHKNLVTRALGVEDTVMVEVHEHRVESDDVYLMCSDGLSDLVLDRELGKIMLGGGALDDKAKRLIDAANAAGGRDNISVVLIQARQTAPKRGLISRMLGD